MVTACGIKFVIAILLIRTVTLIYDLEKWFCDQISLCSVLTRVNFGFHFKLFSIHKMLGKCACRNIFLVVCEFHSA